MVLGDAIAKFGSKVGTRERLGQEMDPIKEMLQRGS